MSAPKVKVPQTAKTSKQLLKRCVPAFVVVALILAGYAAWDQIDSMHFNAVAASDGGAGYDNFFPKRSGATSPGYSTGPDDKGYLKLPGVPDSPRRRP